MAFRVLWALAAAVAAGLIGVGSSPAAEDVVKQAQQHLLALGYKVGTPDGVAGKRTLAAITDVSEKYGLTFDGEVSENEVTFLARIAPGKVTLDFGVAVSQLAYLDAADINGDGRLDFVVAAMGDPFAQLGVQCCFLTKEQMKQLTPPVPLLVYSTPAGFSVMTFPDEAKGNRTQAGKFFTTPTGTYFVVAKNGEMGLPDQNWGEVSMVFKLDASGPAIVITKVINYDGPGVTASVDVADVIGDSQPEILLNNYGPFGPMTRAGTSTLKTFSASETLEPVKWFVPLSPTQPHNYIKLDDIDGNGALDILSAAEVMKSNDGKEIKSKRPGSYVLLNPFQREAKHSDFIYLDPPYFGTDHAGFSLMPVKAGGRTFIFESAMQFFGHEAGGFQYDNLDVFEFSPADSTMTLVTKEVLPKVPAKRDKSGGFYLMRADIDFDGVDEVYRLNYGDKPQYFDWDGAKFALKAFPAKDYFTSNHLGTVFYLPDEELKCTRMVTFSENVVGKKKAEVRITGCLRLDS